MTVRASRVAVATAGRACRTPAASKRTTVAPSDSILAMTPAITRLTSRWRSPSPNRFVMHADSRALQRVLAQEMGVTLRRAPVAERGDRIGGVVAGHHIEQQGCVRDGSRDRADLVLRLAVRDHAAPTDQPARRPDADQTVRRRGRADRLARIAASPDQRKVGRDGRAGAAAGSAGGAGEVVGIERPARRGC